MSTTKHTPTPWMSSPNINPADKDAWGSLTIFGGKPDKWGALTPIAQLASAHTYVKDITINQDANAAFIVRAVNAHEGLLQTQAELVAALRRMVDEFDIYADMEDPDDGSYGAAIRQARAALAKVQS